ncbi:hypothetical protein CYMTET_8476 [Cymbomonas tetramitiformis]|uniref:Myb-like domain-containing protein n=1 Tax=Cymbomonas tetramitiformis TaxID=36881 RepID=A0AAE0GTB7_9CHLO|nr:hypothetical protein CYMTET_8476 [Cymbomonas tetramitiformis]
MGRTKRPRSDTLQELTVGLPAKVYVFPAALEKLAAQQQKGIAHYGSCLLPPSQGLDRAGREEPDKLAFVIGQNLAQPASMKTADGMSNLLPSALAIRQICAQDILREGPQFGASSSRGVAALSDDYPQRLQTQRKFTPEDDQLIFQVIAESDVNTKHENWIKDIPWHAVSARLPGRTTASLKKHWHHSLCVNSVDVVKAIESQRKALTERRAKTKAAREKQSLTGVASNSAGTPGELPQPAAEQPNVAGASDQAHQAGPLIMTELDESQDVGRVLAIHHELYVKSVAAAEELCQERDDWEDTCLVCKDGGELVCCGYGHTKQKKKGYQRKKCYKAYHVECLGILPQHASSIPDDWFCPRHFCVQCKHWKPNSVPEPGPPPQLFSCATCHLSYCKEHCPKTAMHASAFFTQFGAKALPLPDPADACAPRMIVCPSCSELPHTRPWYELFPSILPGDKGKTELMRELMRRELSDSER